MWIWQPPTGWSLTFTGTISIFTDISARVPGQTSFLFNPFGLLFDEVCASNLVKIDLEGNIVERTHYFVNKAGFTIDSAIHAPEQREVRLSFAQRTAPPSQARNKGYYRFNQTAMVLNGQIAYHDYEGLAFNLDERPRLVAKNIGRKIGDDFEKPWHTHSRHQRGCCFHHHVFP